MEGSAPHVSHPCLGPVGQLVSVIMVIAEVQKRKSSGGTL